MNRIAIHRTLLNNDRSEPCREAVEFKVNVRSSSYAGSQTHVQLQRACLRDREVYLLPNGPGMADTQKRAELIELSTVDKDAVLQQIERLLASPHFRNSRRYTDLLRYVVQKTIEGHHDALKERTLGIEVFGREPGFDTAGDSIVRVAAAEVRKRIAQYYQEEGHENELRVDLPSGSYVARFRSAAGPKPEIVEATKPSAIFPTDHPTKRARTSTAASRRMRVVLVIGSAIVVAFAIGVGIRYLNWLPTQKDLLSPLWESPNEAILCIGSPLLVQNQPGVNDQATAIALGQPTANNTVLPFADAITLSRLQGLLNRHRKANRVQLARTTTFEDLRVGPAILIGALDNPWTMRLTEKLRFHFRGTDADEGEIIDSKAKPDRRWSVSFHVPYSDRTQDYAIVAITHDGTLDQPLVIAAGIGPNGTMAAGEFLTDRGSLDALKRMAPAKWNGKNVEVVLATQVIQGNSGPPQIVAVEYW